MLTGSDVAAVRAEWAGALAATRDQFLAEDRFRRAVNGRGTVVAESATAADTRLRRLLYEGNALYHQGLEETRTELADRSRALSTSQLCLDSEVAGFPSANREEAMSFLALASWQHTPGAMAFDELAAHAARRGVCLLAERY
ncbi:hypothetical protein ACIRQH_00175 [Streptomyces sp. NPDC102279]|uniref:hypothetical protein n=1 Tax=Streptomyces sp. NPDC102279 TaxID=3366153 RepID=UPI00380212B2